MYVQLMISEIKILMKESQPRYDLDSDWQCLEGVHIPCLTPNDYLISSSGS